MKYLVTGGAGFVGSHAVLALLAAGHEVIVLDNLRQGHAAALPRGVELIAADLAEYARVEATLAGARFDGVLHFASLSLVSESMAAPFRYLFDNGANAIRLIDACVRHGIPRFVLSSTANLFGAAGSKPVGEEAPIDPGSPYGESKWMIERALAWADRIHGLRSATLRYFNAAGADPEGRIGEDHRPETHLIPLAIDAALGRTPPLRVFGNDYPTRDGTCIRDYVHVSDLAEAHVLALAQLDRRSVTYNLGNGTGYSVLEVIEAVSRVAGRKVPHVVAPRRAGDPPVLVASSARIERETGWQRRFHRLEDIVRTAYAWRERHPHGYPD